MQQQRWPTSKRCVALVSAPVLCTILSLTTQRVDSSEHDSDNIHDGFDESEGRSYWYDRDDGLGGVEGLSR